MVQKPPKYDDVICEQRHICTLLLQFVFSAECPDHSVVHGVAHPDHRVAVVAQDVQDSHSVLRGLQVVLSCVSHRGNVLHHILRYLTEDDGSVSVSGLEENVTVTASYSLMVSARI